MKQYIKESILPLCLMYGGGYCLLKFVNAIFVFMGIG